MAQLIKTRKYGALSGWPMVLCWLAMLIFACHASTHMVGAGDTWVAEACGRHFVHHGVNTVEPFSANSHHAGPTEKEVKTWPGWAQWITHKVGLKTVKYWHPTGWINQNWLTHVLFYLLTPGENAENSENYSFNALVYWKFAIYIITVICVYYMGINLGVYPPLSAAFACFAMFVGRSFFDIRPAGFSNLLVAVFLLILIFTTYRNILYIWLIVPLAVFWCNVHGGYIYAFIMLVPFVALNLLTCISKKRFVSIGLKGIYHTVAAGFVAFLAVIIFNPFHLTNLTHTFIISISKQAAKWRTVNEWHPSFEWRNPVGTSFPFLVLYILSMGLILFWFYSRLLKPRLLKAPKNELKAQKKLFITLLKIFGYAAAVFICWITFIAFSFLNLDVLSFLFCAVFVAILLLSIYKSIHFIYLVLPLTLLAMWSADANTGYTGRYFYPFVLLPAYVVIHILVSLFSKTIKIKPRNIIFPAATAIVTLLVMIAIFNPFKFGSLFTASSKSCQADLDNGKISKYLLRKFSKEELPLSKSATVSVEKVAGKWLITDGDKKYIVKKENRKVNIYKYKSRSRVWQMGQVFNLPRIWDIRRPWVPRYEGRYPLSYKHLFGLLYIINILLIIIWLLLSYLRKVFPQPPAKIDEESEPNAYQLPKIDLALMAIAALTIYMAIRSRRFIPIAAIAACPILAMFIDQMARTISAACNFHGILFRNASENGAPRKQNRLTIPPMPYGLQKFFTFAALVAVLSFGTWWTLKFKRVYLDPWPTDSKLSSVFMRMTASDVKPFYALKFIKANNLKGNMFNYWTEGGFIAWGQRPDPNSGKTPLQLFMDGRAQAAYDRSTYDIWSEIMFGGPIVQNIKTRKRSFTADDYKRIGNWINKRLRRYRVWVVLMPVGQFNTPFVRGLEYHPDWRLIFFNNKQKLFVDIKTPQADKLFKGILNGKTLYPDDFSRDLIIAHILLGKGQSVEQGLDFAIKAFNLNPSQTPMQKILFAAARFHKLIPRVNKFCKDYYDEFEKNKNSWAEQNGYHNKIVAALIATDYLQKLTERQRKLAAKQGKKELAKKYTELAEEYAAKIEEYSKERNLRIKAKRW